MGFKLVRVDATEPRKIPLQAGAYFFGRGSPSSDNFIKLECQDERVSRRHGSMEVSADNVVIEALHINPCFYKPKQLETKIKLARGERIELCNGDQFGLVPDCYWYEIIYCVEHDPATPLVQENGVREDVGSPSLIGGGNTEDSSQLQNTVAYQLDPGEIPIREADLVTSNDSHMEPVSTNHPTDENNDDEELERIFSPQNEPNSDTDCSTSTTPSKRPHSEEAADVASPKRVKTESVSPGGETEKEDGTDDQVRKGKEDSPRRVKTEPTSPGSETEKEDGTDGHVGNGKDDIQGTKDRVGKNEPQSPDGTKAGPSQDQPGFSNTSPAGAGAAPGMPQSPAKAPPLPRSRERCYYGANCYRKNTQHLAQFSHPADSDYGSGECPYGASCSRPDPRHWTTHTHPAGAVRPPPAPHRRAGDRIGPAKRRRRAQTPTDSEGSDSDENPEDLIVNGKRQRKTVPRQSWSGSEEEEEDPYGTDESEEWQGAGH